MSETEDLLYDELTSSPVVEVVGAVSPLGANVTWQKGQELYTLALSFDVWRINGGPVSRESLTIRRRVSHKEGTAFTKAILRESVIKIRARVVESKVFGTKQGLLEQFVELSDDAQIHAELKLLQEPKVIQDDLFGTLTYNRGLSQYEAFVKWGKDKPHLTLKGECESDFEQSLMFARRLWSEHSVWQQNILDEAKERIGMFLDSTFAIDEASEMSVDEGLQSLFVESIGVFPDGRFLFDLVFGNEYHIDFRGVISPA